ncbi:MULTISPECIES: protein tyrosine phosphatase [Legionella]|uniref:Protein tyrosine phosphatase n=1 Tax=Legionella resiliens TaxID=2905958 RepID=A0ABS8X3T7_9GAMM|nr:MULTISPECIES: protein tyrosine phosphatase [unclassified Legionella]MCE0724279.1 protein tyrosine phosphatase [Legionella sp. 9fVS26]MCE3533431.1 protein tyrosine phosphatase [Legionella sp. 8cVS16]
MKSAILVSLFFCQFAYAMNHIVMVGDEKVEIKHTIGKGKTYVHLHHNEQTALKAAQAVIQREGGSLIALVHSGGRNIVFRLNNQRYEFDPNRIFTDTGIKKTLSQFGPYNPRAHHEVNKLATKIKQLLPKGRIVAVHNNSTYSLKDYLPGKSLQNDAQAIHMVPDNYFRNFYLVTKINDFLRLKSQGYNGVLQKPSATDDGSLSVYLAKSDYINVEAGYDQLIEQIKMLQQS